ncbi:hypothetical protein A0J52_09925 [Clostridium sporogenes]|uniref:hypothetical protein n=1 Tax=Clostridium sporogenes TaxID=1509 RepID=UPI0007800309|nr:hypothetical protein [Clostridium sporogenes]KYN77169.1 hypothetical protein A0J52_09925 [Clostridium sporogenes]
MFDVSGYGGKKILVTLEDGTIFKAKGISFMLGESFDEEYNSLALEVLETINIGKDRSIAKGLVTSIYEDEVKNIEII